MATIHKYCVKISSKVILYVPSINKSALPNFIKLLSRKHCLANFYAKQKMIQVCLPRRKYLEVPFENEGKKRSIQAWAQFLRAAKQNKLLSMKFPRDFQDKQTTTEYQ